GARGRCGAGDDGSPGRLWHRSHVWLPDTYGSHLSGVVRHVRSSCRYPARQWAAVLCSGLAVRRAHPTRAGTVHRDVTPWRWRHTQNLTWLAGRPRRGDLSGGVGAWLPLTRWAIGTVDARNATSRATGAGFWLVAAAYVIPGRLGDRLS